MKEKRINATRPRKINSNPKAFCFYEILGVGFVYHSGLGMLTLEFCEDF